MRLPSVARDLERRSRRNHHLIEIRAGDEGADQRVTESRRNRPTHEETRPASAHEVQRAGEEVRDVEELAGLVDQIRRARGTGLRGHELGQRVVDRDAAQRGDQRDPAERPLPKIRLRTRVAAEQCREEADQKHGAGELAEKALTAMSAPIWSSVMVNRGAW